jgi:hypothetical protein
MRKALEDIPREVIFSSALLVVFGAIQFIPNELVQGLPASSFLSGLFGNMIDFVLVSSSELPFHSYTLGLILLLAATTPFIYKEKAWVFNFLTQTVLSLYGFLSLIIILEAPYLFSDQLILGLGLQVLITGFLATQIFKNVLKTDDFSYKVDKTVYALGVWQYLTAVIFMSAFQYVYQFRAAPAYAILFAVLGLYGIALIYASLEISTNSMTGLMLSASFIALLFLSSLAVFSISGVISSLIIAGLFYWKRDLFEKRHSFSSIKDFEL